MPATPGQMLSHYRIVEKIGEGGMGVVYRAEDTTLKRHVALKFLTEKSFGEAQMRTRFLREARTAAALNHPSLCTIHEVGAVGAGEERLLGNDSRLEEGTPFIAMELIEGGALRDSLREHRPLELEPLTRIAVQVSEGLAAAHAKGIVHRDLKPGNVMVTPDGRAKILDFGLAKPWEPAASDDAVMTAAETASEELTREGRVLGTVAYMSPEQAMGKPVDSRSDVFSFGIMLYEMAAGRPPFRGETSTSTLAKILEAEPEPLTRLRSNLPPELERIVGRCLRKQPENRYNDTRDLTAELKDLRKIVTGESASGPVRAARRPRTRWVWAGAVGLAAALLIAGGVLVREWRSEPESVSTTPSVAVLPFQNLSMEMENDYFSAGITEEIISKLSRIQGLEVASRHSGAPYKDTQKDPGVIGEELGVRYLLMGSVRRSADRVRISAQLIDSSTEFLLWADEFEGDLQDVFAMQEQTAMRIAEELDLTLSPQEQREVQRRSTGNPEAYDEYLRAHALIQDFSSKEKLETARRHLERALELDPEFAPALAGLAGIEAQIYRNHDSSAERLRRSEQLAQQAIRIDPQLARAHMALAEVAAVGYDYRRAAGMLRVAIDLEPNDPYLWDLLSWVLGYQQPPDAEGAEQAAREALRLQANFPGAYYHLGRAYLHQGRHREAGKAFEHSLELDPDFTAGNMGLAQYYLAVGDYERAQEEMEISFAGGAGAVNYFHRSRIYAAQAEAGKALDDLEQALGLGFRDFAAIDACPQFASLRSDPRFERLIELWAPKEPSGVPDQRN